MTPKTKADFQTWTRSTRDKRANWGLPDIDWGNLGQSSAPAPIPYGGPPSDYTDFAPQGQASSGAAYHLPVAVQQLTQPLTAIKDFALGNRQMGTTGAISNMWNNFIGPGGWNPLRGEGTFSTPWANAMQAWDQRKYNSPWASARADAINRARQNPATASVADRFTGWAGNLAGKLWGINNNDALNQMNAAEAAQHKPTYTPKTY